MKIHYLYSILALIKLSIWKISSLIIKNLMRMIIKRLNKLQIFKIQTKSERIFTKKENKHNLKETILI